MSLYKADGKHVHFTVTGATKAGAIVQVGTRVGIVDPHPEGRDWAAGEDATATVRGVVEITNGGTAFNYGDTVGYLTASDTATTSVGGDFDAGVCVNQGGAGTTDPVLVLIG